MLAVVFLWIIAVRIVFPGPNPCHMTYMFNRPVYVRSKLPGHLAEQYPQYGLYLYHEEDSDGHLTNPATPGYAVLFLHGHLGSMEQVRALASVAIQKASRRDYHFNYYTVDYNEDFVGMHGSLVDRRIKFLAACIRFILHQPSTMGSGVILISHSFGSLPALKLIADMSPLNRHILLHVSIAPPNAMFPFQVDPIMKRSLQVSLAKLQELMERGLVSVPWLSISGGSKDLLVPDAYSRLNLSAPTYHHVSTPAIRGLWSPVDHHCLTWCKQLMILLNRFLFDFASALPKSSDHDNTLLHSLVDKHFASSVVRKSSSLVRDRGACHTVHVVESSSIRPRSTCVSFLIPTTSHYSHLEILLEGQHDGLVQCCSLGNCSTAVLYNKQFVPHAHGAMSVLSIPVPLPTAKSVDVVTVWSEAQSFGTIRYVPVSRDNLGEEVMNWPTVLHIPKEHPVIVRYKLPFLRHPASTFVLHAASPTCKGNILLTAVALMPWANDALYGSSVNGVLEMSLSTSSTGRNSSEHTTLTLYLDTSCDFIISIHTDWTLLLFNVFTSNFGRALLVFRFSCLFFHIDSCDRVLSLILLFVSLVTQYIRDVAAGSWSGLTTLMHSMLPTFLVGYGLYSLLYSVYWRFQPSTVVGTPLVPRGTHSLLAASLLTSMLLSGSLGHAVWIVGGAVLSRRVGGLLSLQIHTDLFLGLLDMLVMAPAILVQTAELVTLRRFWVGQDPWSMIAVVSILTSYIYRLPAGSSPVVVPTVTVLVSVTLAIVTQLIVADFPLLTIIYKAVYLVVHNICIYVPKQKAL